MEKILKFVKEYCNTCKWWNKGSTMNKYHSSEIGSCKASECVKQLEKSKNRI